MRRVQRNGCWRQLRREIEAFYFRPPWLWVSDRLARFLFHSFHAAAQVGEFAEQSILSLLCFAIKLQPMREISRPTHAVESKCSKAPKNVLFLCNVESSISAIWSAPRYLKCHPRLCVVASSPVVTGEWRHLSFNLWICSQRRSTVTLKFWGQNWSFLETSCDCQVIQKPTTSRWRSWQC